MEKLLTHFPAGGNAYCVVSYPHARESGASDLATIAREIPRLQVSRDDNAHENSLFGATASGTVLFYDAGGTLQFSGGITPARGHEGVNAGGDSLLAAFRGDRVAMPSTPVFGCGLPSRLSPSQDADLPRARAK